MAPNSSDMKSCDDAELVITNPDISPFVIFSPKKLHQKCPQQPAKSTKISLSWKKNPPDVSVNGNRDTCNFALLLFLCLIPKIWENRQRLIFQWHAIERNCSLANEYIQDS